MTPLELIATSELVGLPIDNSRQFPNTARRVRSALQRLNIPTQLRSVNGGQSIFAIFDTLPEITKSEIINKRNREILKDPISTRRDIVDYTNYLNASPGCRATAEEHTRAMVRLRTMLAAGDSKGAALGSVASEFGLSVSTVRRAWNDVSAHPETEWLVRLLPAYKPRAADEIHPEILRYFYADYGRVERPSLQAAWERTCKAAAKNGWGDGPSSKTLKRRWDALPADVRILWRDGERKLAEAQPRAERDRSGMLPLDGVNVDSRTWDLFLAISAAGVRTLQMSEVSDPGKPADERALRLSIAVVQDEASNFLLSYEIDLTENKDQYRRALCRCFTEYGVPKRVRFDNTRAAANKALTAGARNRFRFTERADDVPGILPLVGCDVVFTLPGNGPSKLVERLFAELKERSEKDPRLAGAYTGRSPTEKPANYGSAAADLDTFRAVLAEAVEHYNSRIDRRSKVAFRTSHRAVFEAGLAKQKVRRLSAAQRAYFFTEAKRLTVSPSGTVVLGKLPHTNRFGSAALKAYAGKEIVVRFDPGDLSQPLHAETLGGRLIDATVPLIEKRGFNSTDDSREHARQKRRSINAAREQAAALNRMSLIEAQNALPTPAPAPAGQVPNVIAPLFRNKPPKPEATNGVDTDALRRGMEHFKRASGDLAY